jgi:hypothetical protein
VKETFKVEMIDLAFVLFEKATWKRFSMRQIVPLPVKWKVTPVSQHATGDRKIDLLLHFVCAV